VRSETAFSRDASIMASLPDFRRVDPLMASHISVTPAFNGKRQCGIGSSETTCLHATCTAPPKGVGTRLHFVPVLQQGLKKTPIQGQLGHPEFQRQEFNDEADNLVNLRSPDAWRSGAMVRSQPSPHAASL
jgi:hypothetical protein